MAASQLADRASSIRAAVRLYSSLAIAPVARLIPRRVDDAAGAACAGRAVAARLDRAHSLLCHRPFAEGSSDGHGFARRGPLLDHPATLRGRVLNDVEVGERRRATRRNDKAYHQR